MTPRRSRRTASELVRRPALRASSRAYVEWLLISLPAENRVRLCARRTPALRVRRRERENASPSGCAALQVRQFSDRAPLLRSHAASLVVRTTHASFGMRRLAEDPYVSPMTQPSGAGSIVFVANAACFRSHFERKFPHDWLRSQRMRTRVCRRELREQRCHVAALVRVLTLLSNSALVRVIIEMPFIRAVIKGELKCGRRGIKRRWQSPDC